MQLKARISFVRESDNGDSFCYTEDHDEVVKLGFDFDKSDTEEIKIGSEITIAAVRYIVKNLKIQIYSDDDNSYGIGLYKVGETYPYNLKLRVCSIKCVKL